jgi:hypothetical protein
VSAPNLLAVTTIKANFAAAFSTTGFVALVTNSAASGKRYRVYDLQSWAQVAGATPTIDLYDGSTSYPLPKALPLGQAYGGLQYVNGNYINLLEGWSIRVKSASANDTMFCASWDEWS